MSRLDERVAALGRTGSYLKSNLPEVDPDFTAWTIVRQLTLVAQLHGVGSELQAAALSIMLCNVAVQVRVSSTMILNLARAALAPLRVDPDTWTGKSLFDKSVFLFPIKKHAAAATKANVSFTDVITELKVLAPRLATRFEYHRGSMMGFSDDQAASCILYGYILDKYVSDGVELAIRAVADPVGCKELTVVIKGLGANSNMLGAILCEVQSLQGRGVGMINLEEKARERVGQAGVNSCPDLFTDEELVDSIDYILARELDLDKYVYEEPEETWSRRWLWCVNGGHSRRLEAEEPKWKVPLPGRLHRRVAVEEWTENPITSWSGTCYISASSKLEAAKTRLLLAADTACYVAFEHLLRPVERAWRNERVLLDPGSLGMLGVANRVKSLSGGINVMMDYDDFNAQHTLRAQELVFRRLTKLVNYPSELGDKLCDSFYKMQVYAGGKKVGRATATLMSGHRGTTFINSVLNAAYIRAAEPALFSRFESLHTGDDVVSKFSSYDDVESLLSRLSARGVRLNPMKQSVGTVACEFLRMAITPEESQGYVARSIASIVNGNWVSTDMNRPEDTLTTILTSVRALINRGRCDGISDLFVRCVRRRVSVGKGVCRQLLSGRYALGQGPVFGDTASHVSVNVVADKRLTAIPDTAKASLGLKATTDYLTRHVTYLEREALALSGSSVVNAMTEASYGKTFSEAALDKCPTKPQLRVGVIRTMYGSEEAAELLKHKPVVGVLSRYPILQLIKNRLTSADVSVLLLSLGVQPGPTPLIKAWGYGAHGTVVRGVLPYADAASLSKRGRGEIMYARYPVYM